MHGSCADFVAKGWRDDDGYAHILVCLRTCTEGNTRGCDARCNESWGCQKFRLFCSFSVYLSPCVCTCNARVRDYTCTEIMVFSTQTLGFPFFAISVTTRPRAICVHGTVHLCGCERECHMYVHVRQTHTICRWARKSVHEIRKPKMRQERWRQRTFAHFSFDNHRSGAGDIYMCNGILYTTMLPQRLRATSFDVNCAAETDKSAACAKAIRLFCVAMHNDARNDQAGGITNCRRWATRLIGSITLVDQTFVVGSYDTQVWGWYDVFKLC